MELFLSVKISRTAADYRTYSLKKKLFTSASILDKQFLVNIMFTNALLVCFNVIFRINYP